MDALDPASLRALRWRFEGLPSRLGQLLLIAGLVWLQTRSPVVGLWLIAAAAAALVDATLSRRLHARMDDRRLSAMTMLTRTASAGAFAVVCFVMLLDRSGFGLAAAILVGCGANLNNAVMTRGSRRFFLSLVGPSAACLIALPFAALLMHHAVSLAGCVILTIGTVGYTIFIAALVSTLNKESQALRGALQAAEAANQAKSDFLAVASHEIRTPLNGVLGMAQALEHDTLSPAQRDRVSVIRQSGEALLDVLNDILDLSKIEAGKLELETAPFDLEAVARIAHLAFRPLAEEKGVGFGLAFDQAARGIYDGDAARVRQVLTNLISNALKFTDAGQVEVAVTAHAGGVRLAVSDTGPGVAADRVEHLFDRFAQADSSITRRFGGTGLGLAICRDLCEAMGGTIRVESVLGQGSRFIVDLPLPRSDAQALSAPAEAPAAALAQAAGSTPLRVLAAEDNAVNQPVLRTLLDQVGVELTVVENGAEAVEAWEAGDFDLILMDIQMPVMDGPTAARAIRAREAASGRARTPIIALTANAMKHQVDQYGAAGMDAFVAKPIAVGELYDTMARLAGGEGSAAQAVA